MHVNITNTEETDICDLLFQSNKLLEGLQKMVEQEKELIETLNQMIEKAKISYTASETEKILFSSPKTTKNDSLFIK